MAVAQMDSGARNPVWNVYDEWRTARFNVRYREKELDGLQRTNFIMQIIVAVAASSGVAGLWLFQTTIGDIIWKCIVTIAAIVSIILSTAKYPEKIKQLSEILAKWRLMDSQLKLLSIEIETRGAYTDDLQQRFYNLIKTEQTIEENEPAESPDNKLSDECYDRVDKELPADNFYIPS